MNRFSGMRASAAILWLTVLWILLWGDLSFANVASGIVVALFVLTFARLPRLLRRDDLQTPRVRPVALLYFMGFVLVELVKSNLILAWEIITPGSRINNGVVAVPLRTTQPITMMVVANVITLTPGTMTIEAKGDPAVLYVNVLFLHDVEAVRRDLLHLEELAVKAFGSREARQQFADSVERAQLSTADERGQQ
ncbi:MAG: Na+/H+ antiporter subunit E [Ilumatobacter fluminis]|uniref:Na+/H+ antiporter subunit E n=1 Tax=Ilumatobacter fluminis TaxID=467091 RepID=UPI0032EF37A8